jgi:hypothetical protein
MQKLIVLGGAGVALAIGVILWQTPNRPPVAPSTTPVQIEAPVALPSVASRGTAAPRTIEQTTSPTELIADETDHGDHHGHADHEQGEIQPLVEPPPSRDGFGADPNSETAALAEARATLEALLNDPDPGVKEQASALLEVIAAP